MRVNARKPASSIAASIDARSIAVWVTISLALTLCSAGCGKDEVAPAASEAKAPKAEAAAAAAEVEAPPRPDLGMEVEAFVGARVLERCAARYGEDPVDAETLAVDKLAGRPYQISAVPPGAEDIDVKAAPSDAKAAKGGRGAKAGRDAPAPAAAAAGEAGAAGQGAAGADASGAGQQAEPAPIVLTPGGRVPLSERDDALLATYRKAKEKVAAYALIVRRVDDGVASCHFAPELGLIEAKRIDDYVDASVEIACLSQLIGKPGGPSDVVDHARMAGKIFSRIGVDARSFSQLGVVLGRFADVTARVAKARGKICPDPRAEALDRSGNGAFEGQLSGGLKGKIAVTAQDGDAKGTVHLAAAKKGAAEKIYKVVGVVFDKRVHLQGGEGQDWIRFDSKRGSSTMGTWTAQIDFNKRSGTWTMARLPAEGEVDPLKAGAAGADAAPGDDPLATGPAPAPVGDAAPPIPPPAAPPADAPKTEPAVAPSPAPSAPPAADPASAP